MPSDRQPILVQVVPAAFGSLLVLSDGREVPINIGGDRLSDALVAFERPPLRELLADQSLRVYADNWEMADDWPRISSSVCASPVAKAALQRVPSVWGVFDQPPAFVRGLPQRVYGGLDQAIYTSHPFDFRPDPNRPDPWRYGLLSASGSRLFNIWVHLASGEVDVESGVLVGHFVE